MFSNGTVILRNTSMTSKANKERYEYSVKTSIDLVGQLVSVTSDLGGTDSAVIEYKRPGYWWTTSAE